MHLLLQPTLATLIDFNLAPHMIAIIVPLAGMLFGGIMAYNAMHFKAQSRREWHETARLALEKGQPLPRLPEDEEPLPADRPKRTSSGDIRSGLILIAVGAGLYLFLSNVAGEAIGYVGAIPGFIGVALFLFGVVNAFFRRHDNPPADRP